MGKDKSKAKKTAPAAAPAAEPAPAVDGADAGDAAPPPPPPPSRQQVATRLKAVTIGCIQDLTLAGAHGFLLVLMSLIIAAGIVTLALSWRCGWGVRPALLGDGSKAEWGYTDYNGPTVAGRLHETLGVASQVFGALALVGVCVSILAAVYVLHTNIMFLRGWYEAASAAGGTRAALPGFAVGANQLLWAGLFYGVSQSAVWNGKAGVVPTGRRLRPGWAWYTTLASSLAWLLASHALSRFPPLELVRAWLGPDGAPKLKPVLGALPASLRDSLKQSAGVEIV